MRETKRTRVSNAFQRSALFGFLVAALASTAWTPPAWAGSLPSVTDLKALDGSNGFRLDGVSAGDRSGYSVASAGDINGDGSADLIIGARGADPDGNFYAGSSYVVFGKRSGFASKLK